MSHLLFGVAQPVVCGAVTRWLGGSSPIGRQTSTQRRTVAWRHAPVVPQSDTEGILRCGSETSTVRQAFGPGPTNRPDRRSSRTCSARTDRSPCPLCVAVDECWLWLSQGGLLREGVALL